MLENEFAVGLRAALGRLRVCLTMKDFAWGFFVPIGAGVGACALPSVAYGLPMRGVLTLYLAYVTAREWHTACIGWLDPCFGSDVLPCKPVQCWTKCDVCLGRAFGFLCCVPTVMATFVEFVPRSSCASRYGFCPPDEP